MLFRVMAAKLQRRTETSRLQQVPGCGTWSVATVVMVVVVTLHTWKTGERDVYGYASLATTIPFRYDWLRPRFYVSTSFALTLRCTAV